MESSETRYMNISKTDEWATPKEFFDRLNAEFAFTLDPCSSIENAKCDKFFTIEDNGLIQDWSGDVVFMNPPHSCLYDWVEKAFLSAKSGATVVCLMPARTESRAFHDFVFPFSGINSSKQEYAWAAGIIDGEGCIRVHKRNPSQANKLVYPSYMLAISVKMTDFRTIERMNQIFNARISNELRDEFKDLKLWSANGSNAKAILEAVYPHLVTKQYQAQRGIEFQIFKEKRKIGSRVTVQHLEFQESLYQELSDLKKDQSINGVQSEVRFIRGRLRFSGAKQPAPFPSCIVVFRPSRCDLSLVGPWPSRVSTDATIRAMEAS